MNKYKKNVIFLLILLVSSCYEKVSFNDSDFSPKLVLYGALTQESLIKVKVEVLQKITDTTSAYVPDAKVDLYVDNAFKEQMKYDSAGIFKSDIVAKQGFKYKIIASYKELPTISAETFIPSVPKIKNIRLVYNAGYLADGEAASKLIISMKDIDNEDNYYFLSQIKDSIFILVNTVAVDPVLLSGKHFYSDFLFTDKLFKNRSANLTLLIEQTQLDTNYYNFVLKNLTEDGYKYQSSLFDYYIYNSNNNYFDLNLEPPTIYSNVKNGYGIFYGYNEKKDTLIYIVKKNKNR
jgi:hypothetical protein